MSAQGELVGKMVRAANPHLPGVAWEGRAIAFVDQPCYVLETPSGFRYTLNAAWCEEVTA